MQDDYHERYFKLEPDILGLIRCTFYDKANRDGYMMEVEHTMQF